jgi:putative hydrolase
MMTATEGTNGEANVDPASRVAIERLVPIADQHVRQFTGLPTAPLGAPPKVEVVNRSMWTHHTIAAYRPMFTDLAQSLTSSAPDLTDSDPMATMMSSLNKMMGPAMMGMSVGTMIGQLALRAFGQYDLPLPRESQSQLLIVSPNIERFAADWSIAADDMRMWVLISELTSHAVLTVAHVRDAVSAAVRHYIAGFSPNPNALMERLTNMDLGGNDPMAMMNKFFTDPSILLGAVRSEMQENLAPSLDAMVAALIGYVDHAVDSIATSVLGTGGQIAEAVRRRRVEASPNDSFVEQLLGLRLTQRQVERGNAFVEGVVERAGADGLGRLFTRSGNLPTPSELDAPGLWLERISL